MITLRNVTLRRGIHVLLQDVNWTIYHQQRIGLIGENGSGKSSLFAMLLNQLQADAGDVEIPQQLKLAHVAQETPALEQSALEFVLDGDIELRHLEQQLKQAEDADDGHRIAVVHERLGEIDAYSAPSRAGQLLNGLGFNSVEQQQLVKDFSGGWRVRLNLAKALMCRSDILLLDEPTNHLDLDAVIWLQNWLLKYTGTLILISHDRDFLDEVVGHIAHISHQELQLYAGNYSSFEKQRVTAQQLQQTSYEKQQKQIQHMQAFIQRFKAKASKARQAQSRVKALEKMEIISAVQMDSPFHFEFKEPPKCPNPLLRVEDATIAYGEKIVLEQLNLSITPTDRIALLGPNGAGKSSLIKLLAGEITAKVGERVCNAGVKIGYFDQHQVDKLQLDATPLQNLQKIATQAREQELRGFLGGFGFSGDRIKQPVKDFSGGEKSRLALALLVWQRPNLLLLDEPTNHLDLEMRNALSLALQEYEGAMILVSHDRFLLRSTADQFILVADGRANDFDADLADYEKWLFEYRKQNNAANSRQKQQPPLQDKSQREVEAKEKAKRQPLLAKLKKIETEMAKLQKDAAVIEVILADTALYAMDKKVELQQNITKQTAINKKLKELEEAWLEIHEELEP